MIAGALIGLALAGTENGTAQTVVWICDLIGSTIFIGALKMLVAPLIFFSILAGITSLPNESELWDIGWRTFAYYFTTTSIAVAIGLFFVLTIQPGHRGPREELRANWSEDRKQIETDFAGKEAKVEAAAQDKPRDLIKKNLKQVIVNPFKALADGNSLGIIFFAILLGIALILLKKQARPVVEVITGANAAIMMITGWIMRLAPFFIFCLVLALAAKQRLAVFEALSWYVLTVIVAIAAHNVVLLTILRTVGKRGIGEFIRGIRRAWALAFSSRSSAATMPVTLDCLENNLKVPKRVTDFVIPIGATVNMDGTALYEGIAIIFLIQLYGGMPGAMIDPGISHCRWLA